MPTDTTPSRLSLAVLPDRDARDRTVPRPSILDSLLSAQRDLTAVDAFARRHTAGDVPEQAKYYRDLIPAAAPGPGQQYAFEVDLDACSGCKACVVACHTLNGLDDDETWRDVGLLAGGSAEHPVLQHVTSACHHCVEPACLEGCPVLAYEKDPVTGIVRHLDDQCIGCQYCVLKCPYDVPKYNKSKGIVRKCDMCSSRLAEGEAPACVQGCPNQAIRIRLVDTAQVIQDSESHQFLPGAAEPDYTLPTTTFKTARPLPRNALPADYYRVSPEHAHMPLVVMLVLTQLSVGAFAIGQAANWFVAPPLLAALRPLHTTAALALGLLALAASTLHLGRPLYAFRAVLGLRTSWLSREIVVFGLFAKLATLYAAVCWLRPKFVTPRALDALGAAVALTGLLGVLCSVMIYHDTRRPFWHARSTATKFCLSTLLLGAVTAALTLVIATATPLAGRFQQAALPGLRVLFLTISAVTLAKTAFGLLTFRHLRSKTHTPLKRTALLLAGPLRQAVAARLVLACVGGVMLPLLAVSDLGGSSPVRSDVVILTGATFLMTLATELIERYLFFTAVVAPKMPGSLHHA